MSIDTIASTATAADTTQTPNDPDASGNTVELANLKNLIALQGKDAGCTLSLRGKVVLVCFLVNDGESKWDAAAEAECVEMLKSASQNLMTASGLNKQELQIAYAYKQVTVPYVATRQIMDQVVADVLRQFGHKNVLDYQRHYEAKFARNEAVISFVFNKDFRSYAHLVARDGQNLDGPAPNGEEFSIVSFTPGDAYTNERTLIHEMMHQFGAIDLYYPEYLKFQAEKLLPDSIMNGGTVIDPLTRYVIGWDEELAEDAKLFLKAIENVTEEDIDHARREERRHDW